MEGPKKTQSAAQHLPNLSGGSGASNVADLLEKARADTDTVFKQLSTRLEGLSETEATSRWKQVGANQIAREKRQSLLKMAASSNFGNMFSVVGASAFLPFLPMLPIQVLSTNLLYDFSQTTIPTDGVDVEWLTKPRQWTIERILRFILFIGPISSIFDYLTFFMMLYIFKCWNNPELFRTGWFVESLFTQTLIIHVIRTNKIPFLQSRASWPLVVTSVAIVAVGAWLTVSPLASTLGFVPLPPSFWLFLVAMLVGYALLTQVVKTWFVRRFGE